jgi:hypothetical protein
VDVIKNVWKSDMKRDETQENTLEAREGCYLDTPTPVCREKQVADDH